MGTMPHDEAADWGGKSVESHLKRMKRSEQMTKKVRRGGRIECKADKQHEMCEYEQLQQATYQETIHNLESDIHSISWENL